MPNTSLQKNEPTEVISAEQGRLIDRAKVYLKADTVTEQQSLMYKFLIGATLITLKDCTPHGQFEEVKKLHFPDDAKRTIDRALQFAQAVQFFAKGKFATVANLVSGDRLLTAGELSETEKSALVGEIEKVDKGGVMKTIQAWYKKKHPEPKTEPTIEDKFNAEQAQVDAIAGDFCKAAFLLLLDPATIVKLSPARRQEVLAAGVKVNDAIRALGKKSK